MDAASTLGAAVSPGAPRGPQHRQGTRLLLITQPGNRQTVWALSRRLLMISYILSGGFLTSPLGPGRRRPARRGEGTGCCRIAGAPRSRCHRCCCTGPRRTRGSSRRSCKTTTPAQSGRMKKRSLEATCCWVSITLLMFPDTFQLLYTFSFQLLSFQEAWGYYFPHFSFPFVLFEVLSFWWLFFPSHLKWNETGWKSGQKPALIGEI